MGVSAHEAGDRREVAHGDGKRRPRAALGRRRSRLAASATVAAITLGGSALAYGAYEPGIPPAVDPGTPVFAGAANPVPAEPVAYDPAKSMMKAIFDAGPAAGGEYWF